MNSKVIFVLFVAAAAVQLAVPAGQIWRYEDVLSTGHAYKFRTAPVDPYDAFRGRYVALNFDKTVAPLAAGLTFDHDEPAYVGVTEGADGFAAYTELSTEPPATGDYLRVAYAWSTGSEAQFRLPFDMFFMEESKAPKAEEAYRLHGSRHDPPEYPTYALVRIKGGRGVIEDLYINNLPIKEFLAEQAKRK